MPVNDFRGILMKKLLIAMLATASLASPALAGTVLFDNFDSEAGGSTSLNYAGFANFNVEGGTVDILRQPNIYGLACVGGVGSSCVDLDGSTGNGGILVTKNAFSYAAGDVVSLVLQLSGSQRGSASDGFSYGFRTGDGSSMTFSNVFYSSLFLGSVGPVSYTGTALPVSASTAGTTGYDTMSVSFTATSAGSIRGFVGTDSADNIGPILDNFRIDITPGAVPEPATWAMMIAGFGLVGGALRRRATQVRFA